MVSDLSALNQSVSNQSASKLFHESVFNNEALSRWFRVKRYYAMNFDFYDMEPHAHREFEIMYVASGRCRILFWTEEDHYGETEHEREAHPKEGESQDGRYHQQELELREGEYVFVDCDTRHQLIVTKGMPCRILNLEIEMIALGSPLCMQRITKQSKSLQSFLRLPSPMFKGCDDTGNLHMIIAELHRQLQYPAEEAERQLMQNLILTQFFIELSRQRMRKHSAGNGSSYVRKALAYLSDQYDQDIKVKDIAEDIGISAAYLQRLFKEQTGRTLVERINELRIEKAKILLETSSLPVPDIAAGVGFNSRQHFTYTFCKLAGCSPALYRKHKGDYHVWDGFD